MKTGPATVCALCLAVSSDRSSLDQFEDGVGSVAAITPYEHSLMHDSNYM